MSLAKRSALTLMQRFPGIFNPLWKIYYQWSHPTTEFAPGPSESRLAAFRDIYSRNTWGSDESKSGLGSTLLYTAKLRRELPRLIARFQINSVLDAPCGDFNWMKRVQLGNASYIGADIVPEMIEKLKLEYGAEHRKFVALDIVEDALPSADLWICRDVLFHLPTTDVRDVLRRASQADIKYFLSSTHPSANENHDINAGGFRLINLQKAPYNLPPPLMSIEDFVIPHPPRLLSLWSRDQLQSTVADWS